MNNKNRRSPKSVDGFGFSKPTQNPLSPGAQKGSTFPSFNTRPMPPPRPIPGQRKVKINNERRSLLNTTLPNGYVGIPPKQPKLAEEEPKKHHKSRKKIILRSLLVLVIFGGIIGAWLGTSILGNIDKVLHGNIFSDAHALISTTKLKGESTGRVNFLLAGDSSDDPGHQGADLTDSIMIVSIDTNNHTGFLLSIPRDTWVYIPGIGHEKINSANNNTSFSAPGYPSGGMGQLEQVVSTDLGIPIDYYGLINYAAFKDAVDAVGGITVNIQSSDPRGLYDAYTHLKLPNGEDALSGQEALNLARARGDDSAGDVSYGFPDSDFDRTEHQREMLVALEQKATTVGVLSNPLKVSQLFDSVGNNVQTNMDLSDVLRFVQITKTMDVKNLQSLTLSDSGTNPLLTSYTAPDGEDALIPTAGVDDFSQIQAYYQDLTSGKVNTGVVSESPSVVVLNGSDADGVAQKEANVLQSEGFTIAGVTDAVNEYPSSEIIDLSNGAKPASLKALQQTFKTDTTTSSSTSSSAEAGEAYGYNADFVVVLGKNWDPSQ
jgi:LCP family protein required for cell wall assembly